MSSDRSWYARPLAVGNGKRAMGLVGELGSLAGSRPAPEQRHCVIKTGRREEARAAWTGRSCAPIREHRGAILPLLPFKVGARYPSAPRAEE